jgi:hypothetical protein
MRTEMRALPEATDPAAVERTRQTRWGGAALALGSIIFVMGIIFGLRAFSGNWDTTVEATLPSTAALIQERWASFRVIWSAELLGSLLVASAALLLQRRPQAGRRWMPAGVVWVVVGLGSVLVAASYALTLGSYPPALDAFAEEPAVFAALRGGLLSLHLIGSILQGLGLLAALAVELRWKGRGVPDRIVQVGAGVTVLGILAAVGGLIPGEFGAAAVFLGGALLGLAIWMRGGRLRTVVGVAGSVPPDAAEGR